MNLNRTWWILWLLCLLRIIIAPYDITAIPSIMFSTPCLLQEHSAAHSWTTWILVPTSWVVIINTKPICTPPCRKVSFERWAHQWSKIFSDWQKSSAEVNHSWDFVVWHQQENTVRCSKEPFNELIKYLMAKDVALLFSLKIGSVKLTVVCNLNLEGFVLLGFF